jgi:protein-disulfide isomerase
LAERAVSLQLNEKLFHDCLANRKCKDQLEADLQEGRRIGVAGAPSFSINGIFLIGSQALTDTVMLRVNSP